jgi:hypothetical protein
MRPGSLRLSAGWLFARRASRGLTKRCSRRSRARAPHRQHRSSRATPQLNAGVRPRKHPTHAHQRGSAACCWAGSGAWLEAGASRRAGHQHQVVCCTGRASDRLAAPGIRWRAGTDAAPGWGAPRGVARGERRGRASSAAASGWTRAAAPGGGRWLAARPRRDTGEVLGARCAVTVRSVAAVGRFALVPPRKPRPNESLKLTKARSVPRRQHTSRLRLRSLAQALGG